MKQADADSPAPPEAEVERLLCSLNGVVSARVRTNPLGRLDEIHILASDALHPKQVVRNVESALSAGLGILIDRRVVSVAQVRAQDWAPLLEPWSAPAPEARPEPAAAAESGGPAPGGTGVASAAADEPDGGGLARLSENRCVFVGYDVRNQTNRETVCHVTIERAGERYTGSGRGSSSAAGRVLAAARGLFGALTAARGSEDLVFENATLVEVHGRSYVLVSAQGLVGRRLETLTGLAGVGRSPEEAAVLAGLQAVNRWTGDE